MASENSFSQAIDWYDLALSSNPDKSVIHRTNLRAWYNKGVALFRSGDNAGMDHVFRIIINGTGKNLASAPRETASVLNGIGTIYFVNNDFASATKCFGECLSIGCISSCQRAGLLCNIGSAYYRRQHYEKSEKYFHESLMVAESLTSLDIKATIICKLAYILYRAKHYIHAQQLFSEAALIGCGGEELDDDFSIKMTGYAKTCHQLTNQHFKPIATTTANSLTLNGLDGDETAPSAQRNFKGDGYEGFADVFQINASGDEKSTPSDGEHKVASPGGFSGVFSIMKSVSRFSMAARTPKKEEKESEEDENDLSHNVPNPNRPFQSIWRAVDDSTCMDSNSTNTNNSIEAVVEDDNHLEEVATEDNIPLQKQEVTALKPKFEGRLIPMVDERNATRYSSVVYPWSAKMLTALGVEPSNYDSIKLPSEHKNILCNTALEHLLNQTEDCRAKYALEFEELLAEQLNCKFMTMNSLLDSELHTTADGC